MGVNFSIIGKARARAAPPKYTPIYTMQSLSQRQHPIWTETVLLPVKPDLRSLITQ